jgi:stage III sporulation protein AB
MIAKYVGFVIIGVVSFFVGIRLAENDKREIYYGEGMYKLLGHICREIESFRTPLDEIYLDFTDDFLEKELFLDSIRRSSLEKAIIDSGNVFCYRESTYRSLLSFASHLGKSDPDDQVSRCRYMISLVSEDLKKASEEYPKNRKMYLSLSLLAGATVIILLV